VSNTLNPPITAVFIRILPEEWNVRISMRIELYGCPGDLVLWDASVENVWLFSSLFKEEKTLDVTVKL